MSAAGASITVDWTLTDQAGRELAEDSRVMALAGRLAAALVRPLAIAPGCVALAPGFSETSVRKMAADPSFGPPLERFAARRLHLDALMLAPGFFQRLRQRPASRLCVLIAVEPLEKIAEAAFDLGAIIHHKRILSLVLKADRARLRAGLGEDRLRLATREAPMLYPGLAELDDPRLAADLRASDPQALVQAMTEVGEALLRRFLELCEPELAPIFARRRPNSSPLATTLTETQRGQVVKLLRRRTPEWSDIIG